MYQNVFSQLPSAWLKLLNPFLQSPLKTTIENNLALAERQGQRIFPPYPDVFAALKLTSFENVKVVILGQDPYHGEHQAHGLCFSVRREVEVPPSLKNIYAEMKSDLGISIPKHGDLRFWAIQGVLLLNAILTVKAHHAASHQHVGWQAFTDTIIETLSREHPTPLVFLLWGRYAKSKSVLIDAKRHLVLTAAHPSPLSAHNGFFGCRHFSKANAFLKKNGLDEIEWELSDL